MLTKKRRSSLTAGEFLMFLAGGMFCLILITTAMMGSLLARYTTGNEGTDSARVAKFAFLSGIDEDEIEIVYKDNIVGHNSTEVFAITVTNNSEVATHCDLVITLEDYHKGVTAELYRGDELSDLTDANKLTNVTPGENKILTYQKAGTFPANPGVSETFLLAFTVDWTVIDFNNEEDNDHDLTKESVDVDFDVDVTMYQID